MVIGPRDDVLPGVFDGHGRTPLKSEQLSQRNRMKPLRRIPIRILSMHLQSSSKRLSMCAFKRVVVVAFAVLAGGTNLCTAAVPGDLIANGSFEAGNSGFSTDLGYVANPPFGIVQNGVYGIATNPAVWFTYATWATMGDHTTGSGKMFIATPDPGSARIWYESVNVSAGTTYTFSGWAAWVPLGDLNIANLSVNVGGSSLGIFDLSTLAWGTWGQFSLNYTATSTGPVVLSFTDLALFNDGNDFVLDDLSFAPIPEPGSMALFWLGAAGWMISRRRK
jgi:hypothetical protein